MPVDQIHVFAPATVANVACGFDILGFAIDYPGDEVILRKSDRPGVTISEITGEQGKLSFDPQKNIAGFAAQLFLQHIGSEQGLDIRLHKKMPIGSGLGSSAASAVASLFAANLIFGEPLSKKELLPFAMECERQACGVPHADNVAPALFGGFILIRSYDPLDIIEIPTPEQLFCTVIHPQLEIRTEDARKILKKQIPLKDAIVQWGNTAGLIAGLMKVDYDLIGRSLQDVIIEPVRSILIPGFEEIKKAALQAGALGCSISGSGPSIFALSAVQETAAQIGLAMQDEFQSLGIISEVYVSKINQKGPLILE